MQGGLGRILAAALAKPLRHVHPFLLLPKAQRDMVHIGASTPLCTRVDRAEGPLKGLCASHCWPAVPLGDCCPGALPCSWGVLPCH